MSARRKCVACSRLFLVRLVGAERKPSRARYCGDVCRNARRANVSSWNHAITRELDPARYAKWIGRDFSAMGKLRVQAKPSMRDTARIRYTREYHKGGTNDAKQTG